MFGLVSFLFLSAGIIASLLWIWKAEERNKGDLCESCQYKNNLDPKLFEGSICEKCSRSNLMYKYENIKENT